MGATRHFYLNENFVCAKNGDLIFKNEDSQSGRRIYWGFGLLTLGTFIIDKVPMIDRYLSRKTLPGSVGVSSSGEISQF